MFTGPVHQNYGASGVFQLVLTDVVNHVIDHYPEIVVGAVFCDLFPGVGGLLRHFIVVELIQLRYNRINNLNA